MSARMGDVSLSFAGQLVRPLLCGALFWPAQSLLLAADLHLEKGSALAADGWFLPPYDSAETLRRLLAAARATRASRIALLGDSFHDPHGPARLGGEAAELLAEIAGQAEMIWIAGNHDGLSGGALSGTCADDLLIEGIRLVHDVGPVGGPAIGGHLHPKVLLDLPGGKRVSRRCFARHGARMILPAYGAYAGGLDIADRAFTAALGGPADAVVATRHGLLHVPAHHKTEVA